MRRYCRKMEKMQFISVLIVLLQTYTVFSTILKGPSDGTYSSGSNVTLSCVTDDDSVVWKNAELIFVNGEKFTSDEKYDNFYINDAKGNSNMIITNAQVEDDGEYSCHINDGSFQKAHVTIEVPPELSIYIDGNKLSGTSLPDSSMLYISVTCLAEGARPEVSIRFQIEDSVWLEPTSHNTTVHDMTFDTITTVDFSTSENLNGTTVTCQTYGQEVIPQIIQRQYLYTPVCSFETREKEATCSCRSNPSVYKYVLSIDGTRYVRQNLNLRDYSGSNVSCFGVSVIGYGQSESIVIGSSSAGTSMNALVIGISCIIVVVVAAAVGFTCVVSKKRFGKKKKHLITETASSIGNIAAQPTKTVIGISQLSNVKEQIDAKPFVHVIEPYKSLIPSNNMVVDEINYTALHHGDCDNSTIEIHSSDEVTDYAIVVSV